MARILLIDDDAEVRKGLRMLLERLDFQVDEASDGHHALEQFYAQPVELVITDLWMPGIGGDTVIRSIRERASGTKIIAISGNPDLELALQHGADHALAKPFSLQELANTVRAALSKEAPPQAFNPQSLPAVHPKRDARPSDPTTEF